MSGTAIVLPGRAYSPDAPLLAFAGYALGDAGWTVRPVWWDPPLPITDETSRWVGEQLAEATDGVDGRVLVVGKSLGTMGAVVAAERGYDAIWLTPLLTRPWLVEAIGSNPGRQLLVGGTADDLWDADVATDLAGPGRVDVLQVDGADHAMLHDDDVVRSAETLVEVTRAMAAFVSAVGR